MTGAPGAPPALSDRAAGWLRFLHRKVNLAGDDWSRAGRPAEAWDDQTAPPVLNWHRFDAVEASIAVALMAQVTPAWREVYVEILDGLCRRLTQYWAWHDWLEQRGDDPARGDYPPLYMFLVPEGHFGRYNSPGWAGNGLQPQGFEPDPIAASGNIYFKGFLNFVLGLYAAVSADDRYDEPFDLVYDDEIRFTYDRPTIAGTIATQLEARPQGVDCEINKIWPL